MIPFGTFVHARSGDKGGNANVGLWVGQETDPDVDPSLRDRRIEWLLGFVTPERIRELLPEAADMPVTCHPMPNLGGVNVVIEGLLGEGVASSTRFDPQAKALGEWIRSRHVDVPADLM